MQGLVGQLSGSGLDPTSTWEVVVVFIFVLVWRMGREEKVLHGDAC